MAVDASMDVDVGVNGGQVDKVFNNIEKRIADITKHVDSIVKKTKQAGENFDKGLAGALKTLGQMDQRLGKFEKMLTAQDRAGVTKTLDTQQWGNKIRQATAFNMSLRDASTNAERLQIRMNRILETAAKNGQMSKMQQQRLGMFQEEQKVLIGLDRMYSRLNDKARQSGQQFVGLQRQVQIASEKLERALGNGRRVNFSREVNQLKDALAAYQTGIAGAGRLGGDGGGSGPFGVFGKTGIKGIFARTAAYGGAAMLQFGALQGVQDALKFVKDFEAELKQLQAISGATNIQMKEMAAAIVDVGNNSRFSLLDLTKMSQVLAQAGISAGRMSEVLKAVTTLATASGSTPDEATQLVTSALGSFQLQGSEAARVADLMTEALNRTKLTVGQVGQAIQYVGATAYEQNITLEQLLSTIGAIAQAGVRSGSTIGTGFRQFLVDMDTPSDKMLKTLDKYKLTAADVDVQTKGLREVLETMSKAGIGAADAYTMMEVRAAAFYLTAKNNTDVMDMLQLQFSNQEASVRANAVAMDSLSAQWQRFKNQFNANLFEMAQGPLLVLKNLLKEINDFLGAGKTQEAFPQWKKDLYELDAQISGGLIDGLEKINNYLFTIPSIGGGNSQQQGFGTWLRSLSTDMNNVSGQAEILATKVAETGERIEEKRVKVDALTKELQRLYTQESSLKDNTIRLAAETTSLTSRFEGLATYLGTNIAKFKDLTKAMQDLRGEEEALLRGSYIEQIIQLKTQNIDLKRTENANRRGVLVYGDKSLRELGMTAQEIAAVKQTGGNRAEVANLIGNAASRLLSAADKLGTENDDLARVLNALQIAIRSQVNNNVQIGLNQKNANTSLWNSTNTGKIIQGILTEAEADIQAMQSLEKAARQKAGGKILTNLEGVQQNIDRVAMANNGWDKLPKSLQEYFIAVRDAAKQLQNAAHAQMKSTLEEEKADKKADKEQRKLTRNDIDQIGLQFGLQLGEGYRTQAQQDYYRSKGWTKAKVSDHTTGIARDFKVGNMPWDQMRRIAALMQDQYDRLYGKGMVTVIAEDPAVNGMGSGKHIHAAAKKGAYAAKRTEGPMDALDILKSIVKTEGFTLNNLAADMAEKFKDLKYGVTQETFYALAEDAEAAIEAWGVMLRQKTLDEAAAEGLAATDPETQERLRQVEEQIKQKHDELADSIFDNYLKLIAKTTKAIDDAFEAAMLPYEARASQLAAAVSGLGYYSNQGRVPDYVQTLAQRRSDQGAEQRDIARSSLMAQVIADKETQMAGISAVLANTTDKAKAEELTEELLKLSNAVATLRKEKQDLDTALAAGGLIPTTIGEGIKQAAQAYYEANQLGQTFTEFVNMNLTDAISVAHQGMTTFFTDIITGSKTVKQAFADFVKAMINYLAEMAAKFLAAQVFKLILGAFSGSVGGPSGGFDAETAAASAGGYSYHGGIIKGAYRGEPFIRDGHPGRDSTLRRVSRGEAILRRAAVSSLGEDFVRELNERGAGALRGRELAVPMPQPAIQETNVYVVSPDKKPQLGKNDVLVIIQDDLLKGGATKKLVKHIAQGG